MDETVSVEATVAGEAATAAVEELHSREEVADTAETAAIIATDASMEATMAADSAAMAESLAADAFEVSQSAVGQAQEASEAAATTAYLTADVLESYRTETDERIREIREYVDSRIPLPAPESQSADFEEVEADDGTASPDVRNSGGSNSDHEAGGTDAHSEEGSSGEADSAGPKARYGLRHRRR